MSSSSSEDETLRECETSPKSEIVSLPAKSRERYIKAYEAFIEWRTSKGFKTFSEAVFMAYFKELSKTKQASTLWSTYSMLKATVSINNDIRIDTYPKLVAYLKVLVKGYISKKTKVLTPQNVETFIKDAPDDIYLAMKVALIFGISGACRNKELIKLRPEDIQKHSDQVMLVNLMKTPTIIERSFLVRDKYVQIVEKYQALRPADTEINRFFVNYQHGKCTRQAIGRNKISDFPKKIASFLDLPNPELYTGHCLRTSAIRLAKSRSDVVMLKQLGRHTSNPVAEYSGVSADKRLSSDPTWRLRRPTAALWDDSLLEETQQHGSPVNGRSSIKIRRCESLLDGTRRYKALWSESPANDNQSMKSDDPFDPIPEEYAASAAVNAARGAARRAGARARLAALRRRRLRLAELRARQLHARETQRLRVEARRLEVDAERSKALQRIADVAMAWLERLKANGCVAPRHG